MVQNQTHAYEFCCQKLSHLNEGAKEGSSVGCVDIALTIDNCAPRSGRTNARAAINDWLTNEVEGGKRRVASESREMRSRNHSSPVEEKERQKEGGDRENGREERRKGRGKARE